MHTDASDDDGTEILQRDAGTAGSTNLAAAATQVQSASCEPTDTLIVAPPHHGRSWHWRWWVAALALTLVVAGALAYYAVNRSPATIDTARLRHDAYDEAHALATRALERGDVATLPARLLVHARAQPDHPGLSALLRDAARYRDMLDLRERGHLLALARARRSRVFESPLFEDRARRTIDTAMPPAAILQRLLEAEDAWHRGDLVAAISSVKQLSDKPGNPQAQAMLQRYSQLVQNYEALSAQGTGGRNTADLLAFYLGLDPVRDRFFWSRLARDARSTDASAAQAWLDLQRAGQLWSDYHRGGGIDGPMRQAAAANAAFGERAAQLTTAAELVHAVIEQMPPPQPATARPRLLPTLIGEEIGVQRDRLQGLQQFNNEAVFARRLQMLQSPARAEGPRSPY
ncbi:MAG: hypothetical protein KDI01_02930 [Halioglobus sp.]|nr:hypothetical protein [Halioglobus sp.]